VRDGAHAKLSKSSCMSAVAIGHVFTEAALAPARSVQLFRLLRRRRRGSESAPCGCRVCRQLTPAAIRGSPMSFVHGTPASRTADAQHRRLFSLTRELCPTIPSRPVQRSDSSVAADSVCAVCLRVSSRFIGPCDPVAWRVLACRPKACGVCRVYATSHRHTCTAVQHGRYRRIFDILAPHHRIQGSLFADGDGVCARNQNFSPVILYSRIHQLNGRADAPCVASARKTLPWRVDHQMER
jgi:hypothetical protein